MKLQKILLVTQKKTFFPNYSGWIFLFLFMTFAVIYQYPEILTKPPQSLHRWRQCDCLSITMNYFQDNNPFLEPSVHYLGNGTGKTVSDFPLIYYTVAQLWKIFGHHEFIYRLVVLLFFFSGLFALFRLAEATLQDSLLAMAIPLFLFTSPTLVYYGNNFLMDIPAFSMALVGLYFFFKFLDANENKYLYYSAISYTIAGLLKISSLLSFSAIVGLFVLELFPITLLPNRKIFSRPWLQGFVLLLVVIIPLVWYSYAKHYNANNNADVFLIGIIPLWDMNSNEIKNTLIVLKEHFQWDYFRLETHFVLISMFLLVFVCYKKTPRLLLVFLSLLSAGACLFLIFFFQALQDHDYYTINLFVLVPIVLLTFFVLVKIQFPGIYNSLLFRISILLFLIHNVDFARRRMEDRYKPEGWQNTYYTHYLQPFQEIQPYLRSIGIQKNDRVVCLPDSSFDISLYLMNQKGWTSRISLDSDSSRIKEVISRGAKYLFIFDPKVYQHHQGVQPFLKKPIGKFKNVDIYEF